MTAKLDDIEGTIRQCKKCGRSLAMKEFIGRDKVCIVCHAHYDQLLTVAQVAERLLLTRGGVYKLVYEHKIPCTRVGSRLRFRRKEIEDYLSSRTTGARRVREMVSDQMEAAT